MPASNTTATKFVENGTPYRRYMVVHCKDKRWKARSTRESLGSGWRDLISLLIRPPWTKGIQGQSEGCTTKTTMDLIQKIMEPMCVICFDLFWIWVPIPTISPRGLIFGGTYYRRGFCVSNLRGLCLGGLIFGILRYRNACTQLQQ